MPRSWSEARLRAELVAGGAALARRGLIRSGEGNLSARLGRDRLLITPRGADKGRLTGPDIVLCSLGEVALEDASIELPVHLAVYRVRSDVVALAHAHPRAVLAADASGVSLDPAVLAEAHGLIGRIARVEKLAPGSAELAAACAIALRDASAAVLAGHGALAVGRSIAEAVRRLEVLELLARVVLARSEGGR